MNSKGILCGSISRLRLVRLFKVLLLLVAATPVFAAPRESRPNVVFILADDLGWTDLGCQGSTYYKTPHIDQLASEGMRFTSGYSCGPNCQPTRAALMSGQYGPRTGVYTVGSIDRFDWRSRPLKPVDNVQKLPLDRQTLAEGMKAAGYATGMFGKWHLGNDPEHHPGARGFDEAIESSGKHYNFKTDPPTKHPKDEYLADFLTDKALDFIRQYQDEPFFLYLPHYGVHSPYQAKPGLIRQFEKRPKSAGHFDPTYAAMIASVDQSVGRVAALLDELGLAKNTLVIFSSDNGGVGGYERLGIQGKSITDNAPLRGGKGMLYEGGIRAPYLFRWPGTISAGVTCDVPINSVDLFPTLLEVAGGKLPVQTLDGTSYLDLLTSGGKSAPKREAIYWHFPGYLGAGGDTWRTSPVGAIREGDWKLLEFFEDGRLELYNLREDIAESKNLAAEHPDVTRRLHDQLRAWRKKVGATLPTPNEKPTPSESKTGAIESENTFHAACCEGTYAGHLQGVATNHRDAIYWSFTTDLVRTDTEGAIQKRVEVASHHGDLCFHDGKLLVAVNLGEFNQPAGKEDSWVYEYDAVTLAELARYPVPELVHGAGGIAVHDDRFYVVGGLPADVNENYVYEYDRAFKFQGRHMIASGHTHLGIQTAAYAQGSYWFGCYGIPQVLLKTDADFKLQGKWNFNASLGLVDMGQGQFLVAEGARGKDRRNSAYLNVAVPDPQLGLRIVERPAK